MDPRILAHARAWSDFQNRRRDRPEATSILITLPIYRCMH